MDATTTAAPTLGSALTPLLPELRRPPAATAVGFKVQDVFAGKTRASVVAFVDARFVYETLNGLAQGDWLDAFHDLRSIEVPEERWPSGDLKKAAHLLWIVSCRLTVAGVTRGDVGTGSDPKGAHSDAIKRAAVHFGLAAALHSLPRIELKVGTGDGDMRREGGKSPHLDERTRASLRARYEAWLADGRVRERFGAALTHGESAEEAPLDPEAERTEAATEHDAGRPELRAVPAAGEQPAAALSHEQQLIAERRTRGAIKEETVAALAELMYGERELAKLKPAQARNLAELLALVIRGGVSDPALAKGVAAARKRENVAQGRRGLRNGLKRRAAEAAAEAAAAERAGEAA